jgi:hypothetical protein
MEMPDLVLPFAALCVLVTAGCDSQCDQRAVYVDADGDGFGDDDRVGYGCEQRISTVDPGFSFTGGDCDDGDPAISPEAVEVCNGLDDNCSGQADEGVTEVLYFDGDGDGYGDAETAREACRSRGSAWVARSEDCDDDEPEAHPGRSELCGDGIDNDCDGAELPCTGALTDISVTVEGLDDQDYLGTAIALGDFDGDGQEDLLTGARRADGGSGAAYILYGPIVGGEVTDAAAQTATLSGSGGERAGFGVGAADLDGDGWPEAIIGAVDLDDTTPSAAGGVYIIPSGTRHGDTALSGAILIEGDGWQGRLGRGISGLGDLTGDGLDEVLIGASEYPHPDTSEPVGAAFVLLGGDMTSGSITDRAIRILGDDPDGLLAHQGGISADLDGDGHPDLLTSAYNARAPGETADSDTGRVYLLTGPLTEDIDLAADPAPGLIGASSNAKLGYGMAVADTDGDGYPEAWLGSHGDSQATSLGGAVWCVSGSADLSTWDNRTVDRAASASIIGTELEGSFGSAVALADLNGDTHTDLIIGAMYRGSSQAGAAAVFYGPISGSLSDIDADITLSRSTGTGQAGEHLLIGGDLLGSQGPVLVIAADGESEFAGPEGEPVHRDQAGAIFLVDLMGW